MRLDGNRVVCGLVLLLSLAGCAVDDHRPAQLPPTVSGPPEPAADHGYIVPAATIQRVAYLSADGRTIPEPAAAPAPLPPIAPQATEPVPAPAEPPVAASPLTLEQAMAETLQSDPKLRGAMETIRQAQGDFVTSSLLPNPTVQVNGVFLPLRTFTSASPGGPPELDVIATYPIDWYLFGKRAAAMTNAQWGVAVSNADYFDQVRQRLANTAAAYYDVLEARAMLKLAEEDLANLEDVETRTQKGVKAGGAGTIEAERIRLSVLDAQREVRTRATTLATSKAQLRAAIGRARESAQFELAGGLDVSSPAAAPSLGEAIAAAERNRPDIISLRRQIAKARSGIEVERTKARPSVAPSLGYQDQFQECNGVADASAYTAQINVSVPLFDRNQGNIAKAQSVLAQSCFNLQAQLVQAEADIEQAVVEFQAARNNVVAIGPEQVAKAESVRKRTEDAFHLGGKTMLEFLDAERACRDTHRNYILGQSSYWHALHKLNAAVGQKMLQ